jgi:hypothetical protein
VTDPERQWIARLESEVPEEPDEALDDAPLSRVRRVVSHSIVLAGGAVGVLGLFSIDAQRVRIAALAVLALLALLVNVVVERRRKLRPARETPSPSSPTFSDPT